MSLGAFEAKDDPCLYHAGCPRCIQWGTKGRILGSGRKTPLWIRKMRLEPCHYCGGPGGTIDHVIPRSRGGRTNAQNCVPACATCNVFRGNAPYNEFKAAGWKRRPFA